MSAYQLLARVRSPRCPRLLTVAVAAIALLVAACTSSTPRPATPSGSSAGSSTAASPARSSPGTPDRVLLSALSGATVPLTFILVDDTAGVTQAKFYLSTNHKTFLSSAEAAPFQALVTVAPGQNEIEVRHTVDGSSSHVKVTFTAAGIASGTAPSKAPSLAVPPSRPFSTPAPTQTVSSSDELKTALARARPGTVIKLLDGEYINGSGTRWHLAANGTADAPIVLEGGRGAMLESRSTSGDYAVWITGSYWQVTGITVRQASKGIVLDGSQHSIIDNVEVNNIGDEGVHFRSCSSYGVLQNSSIHDTGLVKPQFGEGVYVGSAQSNWGKYGGCGGGQDKTEGTAIRSNTFTHIAAEGADLKEGTDSGLLANNTFSDAGYSGKNSADSAVDIKGNGWVVVANIVANPQGADHDAFQTHTLYQGYGTNNTFTGNTVEGDWPGHAFALSPLAANVVRCNNHAPGASQGLVADGGKTVSCAP